MKKKTCFILLMAVLSAAASYGQKNHKKSWISGYVTDGHQYPVIYANILINNNITKVFTDDRGFYKVKVDPGAKTIGISTYTHDLLEEDINGRTRINFAYTDSVPNQLVIKGNAEKQKELMLGQTASRRRNRSMTANTINCSGRIGPSYRSIYEMLQSEVPGVQVHGESILIRGVSSINESNEPLFVVNGVFVESIDDIHPDMVKSIEVRKGSTAAIFGSRALNGAIVINLLDAKDK
jgi:hypothetical protein